jgi:superfamily II RNA helicase
LAHADINTLTSKDLMLKGVLATEINEGNPMVMTELYLSKKLHDLSAEQIVVYLSCFLESSQDSVPLFDIWDDSMTTEWMPVIEKWIHGEELSTLCSEFELFEGNMVRILLKLKNIIEEWINMAIYCQHTEMVEKMMTVTHWNLETNSLYLK